MALTRVNGNLISSGTITGNLFLSNTITGDKIASATIGSSNLTSTGVTAGIYGGTGNTVNITVDAQGRVTSAANVASVATTPAGSNTQIQFNNSGAFGASANLVFDGSNLGVGTTTVSPWATYKGLDVGVTGAIVSYESGLAIYQNAYYDGTNRYKTTEPAAWYNLQGGNHQWFSALSGNAATAVTFTQSLAVGKGTTLALEGATSGSGTGITFPATQSASSDANTLDDYEEGTWTPNQGSGLTVVGTFSSSGTYTKIGRLVFLTGQVAGTTSVAVSATNTITENLPFPNDATGTRPTGSAVAQNQSTTSNCLFTPSQNSSLAASSAIAATAVLSFSATYWTSS